MTTTRAGIEIGARVSVTNFDDRIPQTGHVVGLCDSAGKEVTYNPAGARVQMDENMPAAHTGIVPAAIDYVVRDPQDAQRTRKERIEIIVRAYPHEDYWRDQYDDLPRFVLVTKQDSTTEHAVQFGETFDSAVDGAGGEIFDGWMPEAVFDLDTGERIEVHVSSPIITRSEDQGAMVNVFDGEKV